MHTAVPSTDKAEKAESKLDYYPALMAGFLSAMTMMCWPYAPVAITAMCFGGAVFSGLVALMSAIEHAGGKTTK